ncbi:nectin-2 isoform X3 [Vanacampus margaritifer]
MAGQTPLPSRQDCVKVLLLLLASTLSPHGASGQRVKVEPEVLSYPGQTVNLRCAFTDTTGIQLTMVTWIYEPKEGERMNIAVLHPSFEPNFPDSPLKGRVSFMQNPPNVDGPTIQISDVRMTDEGKYTCEFASYPSGNEQGITQLVMLTKPQNSASPLTVEAGQRSTVVARCESLNGRPAAQIRWVTTANGNGSTSSKPGQDNTVSVTSEYRLAPTAADNGKDISCVVSHRTQTTPESFQMKLKVLYAPQVTIVGYDNNWYVGRTNVLLTCQASGNPVPTTVLWKSMTGEMPDTVHIKDNQLKVLKVDEAVNTTFVCEVKNRVGTGRDQVTAYVRESIGAVGEGRAGDGRSGTGAVASPLGPLACPGACNVPLCDHGLLIAAQRESIAAIAAMSQQLTKMAAMMHNMSHAFRTGSPTCQPAPGSPPEGPHE